MRTTRPPLQQVIYGGILWRLQNLWGSCVGLQACGGDWCLVWLPCPPLEYETSGSSRGILSTSCHAHSLHLPSTPSPIIMEQPLGACELLHLPCDWCREHCLRFFYAWRTFSTSFWIFCLACNRFFWPVSDTFWGGAMKYKLWNFSDFALELNALIFVFTFDIIQYKEEW